MSKTTWLVSGLILVVGLSGCGGRWPAETDQPKASSVPTVSEATKAPAESAEATKAPAESAEATKSAESQTSNINDRQDIDQLIESLNELGNLVDNLDSIDESSLIIPEA